MPRVHGSLARAGKVKNATPKVSGNTERKKKYCGVAGKRVLFNKRYASLKKGTNPLRMRLNSQEIQQSKKLSREK